MKKFLRLSLVVFFTLLFNSCEKEEIIEEQVRDSLVEELEISDALDWVNSGSSNTRTQLLIDEAYTQSLKNGNMVAIPYFLDKETGIYVRLLMTKINGEIKAKYITLIPELEYHLERGYSTRYKDMDGRINIFDSEGNFEVGYLFEDGVYNGTIYRQSTTSRLNGKCGDCLECEGTCLEEVVVVGDSPTDEDGFDFEDFWDYEDPLPFNDDRFEPGGGEEDYYYNEPEGAGGGGPSNTSCADGFIKNGNGTCVTYESWISNQISKFISNPDCIKLRSLHGKSKKDQWDFYNKYQGISRENIINDEDDKSITGLGSQPGGPDQDFRYIEDPLNPNLIIDMRHMLVIGKLGRGVGESVEFIQWLGQKESAFDDQDYYSNELGYAFYREFGASISNNPTILADHLITFLNDPLYRNNVSSPDKCR